MVKGVGALCHYKGIGRSLRVGMLCKVCGIFQSSSSTIKSLKAKPDTAREIGGKDGTNG